MTCYLLHSSLYLTRLTEAQLVCADLCWWDEGISHTVQNCAFVFVGRGVALTDGCHTARAHGGNVESVAVSFGKSLWCFPRLGKCAHWLIVFCEYNSNTFQNAALHFSVTAMSEFGVCAFMIQDDPACVTALKAKQTSVLSCCNPQWQPACCLCCELEQ